MFDICILPWFTGNIRISFQASTRKLNTARKMKNIVIRMRNNYFTGCRDLTCCAGGFSCLLHIEYNCNIFGMREDYISSARSASTYLQEE